MTISTAYDILNDMDIREEHIKNIYDLPCSIQLCNITATEPHFHSKSLELVYCLEGSLHLVAGHQSVYISPGEIFSIDYRDIHYLSSKEDNLTLICHLDLTRLHIGWETLEHIFFACESSHCYPYQKEPINKVKDLLLSMAYMMTAPIDMEKEGAKISKLSNRLIDILFKYFNWYNYESFDEYVNMDYYNRFYRFMAYCNENYMHKITVSQLALMEHINKNYVSQFIKKTVFESFSSMIKYIRCYEAEQLLLKTDMSVADISYACGFSDPKYFYRAFKGWWGCTPTMHRKKYEDYMKTKPSVTYMEASRAPSIIRRHIAKWHLEKNLL